MSEETRVNKTQRAMAGDRKGAEVLADILMKHRTGQLPPSVYFKDEKGHKRINLDKAWKWRGDK